MDQNPKTERVKNMITIVQINRAIETDKLQGHLLSVSLSPSLVHMTRIIMRIINSSSGKTRRDGYR